MKVGLKGPDKLCKPHLLQLTCCVILLPSHGLACHAHCNELPQPWPAGLQSIWLRRCQRLQSCKSFR